MIGKASAPTEGRVVAPETIADGELRGVPGGDAGRPQAAFGFLDSGSCPESGMVRASIMGCPSIGPPSPAETRASDSQTPA